MPLKTVTAAARRAPSARRRWPITRGALAVGAAILLCATVAPGTAVASGPSYLDVGSPGSYDINVGPVGTYDYPTDTPAAPYIDKDGTFYFQQSASLYGAPDPHYWEFYSGTNFADATRNANISDAINPANPRDKNNDTIWRCNNSPTGKTSTYAPGTGYDERNYCDLLGVWLDPDTGNWIGLVHNEFTPVPFPKAVGFQHYDAIDYAVSTNQGKTWTIKGHAITSPYSTTRNDNAAFPKDTWDYGDGDQRLFVDYQSGYFYVYYGSRIQNKSGAAETTSLAHVARAPLTGKMASGTWQKWYDGSWSQAGVGGLESNMVPVKTDRQKGYTAPRHDYNPRNPGRVNAQIAAGTIPSKSPLLVMNITYDAYLGLYLGEPETIDQSKPAAQQIYATKDLNRQQWQLIGDTGNYKTDSWYRWIVDSANLTNPTVVGRTFRSYCSIACSQSDGEYVDISIDSRHPVYPVSEQAAYQIVSGDHRALAQEGATSAATSVPVQSRTQRALWRFVSDGDGSYRIVNAATGKALGVNSASTAQRAWGTKAVLGGVGPYGPSLGQQWFIVGSGSQTRLVNRYSGLVLSLSSVHSRRADTTPARTWTGAGRTAKEQSLALIPRGGPRP